MEPTELQHRTAEGIAALMRETLPTRDDKEAVVAILLSAALRGEDEISEADEWRRWEALVRDMPHAVVLDCYGRMPGRPSLQARLGNLAGNF